MADPITGHLTGTVESGTETFTVEGDVTLTPEIEPTPEPTPEPEPTPTPPSGPTVDVPAPSGGDDRATIQGIIDRAADGTRIVFKPGATYKVGASVGPGKNKVQKGLILDGGGALIDNVTPAEQLYRHGIAVGGTKTSKFYAVECTVEDFRVRSRNGGGHTSWGHGVLVTNRSHDVVIRNVLAMNGHGDGFYVGVPGGFSDQRGGPYNVSFIDCVSGDTATSNWDRHCGCVTNAHHVTFTNCTLDKKGSGAGGTVFDIEPLNDGDIASDVLFDGCTFGWYSPNDVRRVVQANGAATGEKGAYCKNVTVRRSRSKGNYMGLLIHSSGGPRYSNFLFEDNVSDPAYPVTLPMVNARLTDGLIVRRNRAPISTGRFVKATDCTGVVAPTSGADANVDTS